MTRVELQKLLDKFPPDMEVIYAKYSDYKELEADEIEIVTGVDQCSYVMRPHATMSRANRAKATEFIAFPGN